MMWSTNSGISFFGGFGRLPLPPGQKDRVIGLLSAAGSVLILVLAHLFGMAGAVLYAIGALVVTWRPLSRLGERNRAHQEAIRLEQRGAAAEDDTDRVR